MVIQATQGPIIKADMDNGNFIQFRSFDGSGSHSTFDFIKGRKQVYEYKFNK